MRTKIGGITTILSNIYNFVDYHMICHTCKVLDIFQETLSYLLSISILMDLSFNTIFTDKK